MRLNFLILACLALVSGFAKMATADPCPPPECGDYYIRAPGGGCVRDCRTPECCITGTPCWFYGDCSGGCEDCYVEGWCPEVAILPLSPPITCVGCEVCFETEAPNYDDYYPGCCDCMSWGTSPYPVGSGGGECWFIHAWLTTGFKMVTARLPCGSQAQTGVTVIELASLLPDVGEEIDDGDGNPNTKSFIVCVADSGVVTVTAITNPVVSEPGGCWSLEGGTGTSQLSRTVDRTTPGVTTITCVCGSSWKETKIYVYEAKLKLYAKGGLSYIPPLVTFGDFGHSWWKLEFSHPELLVRYNLDYYVNKESGYWPAEGFPIYWPFAFVEGLVIIGDQSCTEWTMGEWKLEWLELRMGLTYTRNLYLSPDEFSAYYHNCTDEAVIVGETVGVETINYSDDPTLPWYLFLYLLIH